MHVQASAPAYVHILVLTSVLLHILTLHLAYGRNVDVILHAIFGGVSYLVVMDNANLIISHHKNQSSTMVQCVWVWTCEA